jgi:hypothetical protein
MSSRILVFLFLLAGCTPDPAELRVSLVEPATANAQYFHGNCFAGFSVSVDLRVQETRRVSLVLSRLSYRLTHRGTGLVVVEESLDTRGIEERYGEGASSIPAGATRLFRIGGVLDAPVGPIAVTGRIEGMDENDQSVVESFDLSATLVVNDPGPPSGGACVPP